MMRMDGVLMSDRPLRSLTVSLMISRFLRLRRCLNLRGA